MNPASLPLVATVLVAGAVAIGAGTRAPSPPEMVEVEVADVFPLEGGQAGMLVLREKGRETLLPIVIGREEAEAIEMRLRHREPVRPRAEHLLQSAIDALGARVVRVEITGASEALYRARVHLAQGSHQVALDARPSDSVALALGTSAPIYASGRLLADAGLTPEDLRRMEEGVGDAAPHPLLDPSVDQPL